MTKFHFSLLLLLLAGCGHEPAETGEATEEHYLGLGKHVYVTVLDDGTRCAVYDGAYAGGISCDWK